MKTLKWKWYVLPAALLFGSAAAALLFNCSLAAPSKNIKHIVLISVDTCRADYLGCYGNKQGTTPCMDAIAAQGTRFTNVVAPAPMTLPSHSTMLTGTIPPYHGVHTNLDTRLGQSNITLPEMLRENGFTTGAIVSTFVLDSQFGMDQGFATYNDTFEEELSTSGFNERRGGEASKFANQWLEEHQNEKFFLFLHYYDPHDAYNPPEPFATQFKDDLYAGEIAYTDHCISQVIDKLKTLDLFDSTLLIIAGDHGEMLGEHNESGHSYYVYQSAVKVPLIFKLPGQHKPRTIDEMAGLIDITPTVCGLLDIPKPSVSHGKDLSPWLLNEDVSPEQRYLYCESMTPENYNANPLLCIMDNRWKYIKTTRPELYNLVEDPQEANNLAKEKKAVADSMDDLLLQVLKEQLRENIEDNKLDLDQDAMDRLASLGYVGGSIDGNYEFDQSRKDPKDLIIYHKFNNTAATLFLTEKYQQAKLVCQKLIATHPDIYLGHNWMAKIAIEEENTDAAIRHLTAAADLAPDRFELRSNLGNLYATAGNIEEGLRQYREALRINPDCVNAHVGLGIVLASQKKIAEAVSHYAEALRINHDTILAHMGLGNMLVINGDPKGAAVQYRHVLRIDPDHAEAHQRLGDALMIMNQADEAIDHYTRAFKIAPGDQEAKRKLREALLATRTDA